MLRLWRNKKATGIATVAEDDAPVANDEAPRRPAGDLQPSPHPSPKDPSSMERPRQNAAAQDKDGSNASARLSAAPSKERTPSKATLKWRRNQARQAALGHEEELLSPLFEIKQTEDVEAERAANEAALRALEEPPPDQDGEAAEKDEFVKKPKSLMDRLWAKKAAAKDEAVGGALAEANEAAANSAEPVQADPTNTAASTRANAASTVEKALDDQVHETEDLALQDGAAQVEDDDVPPPPPPEVDENDEEHDAHASGQKKNLKHDPSRERRRVAFDIAPRGYQRWKGLGLHDPVEESNTIQMRRAAEVSENTKKATKKAAVMQGIVTINRIGAVHLSVVEAKGLPKIDEQEGCKAFVMTRMLATEFTTKPDFEEETPHVYDKAPMARTVKIKWYTELEISIKSKDSWLECEVFVELGSAEVSSLGRWRMPVEDIAALNGGTLDNWYLLKGNDGSARSAAIHVTARYEEQANDPKELALMARQEREALLAEALPDIPDWISAWDVRCVRKFSEDIMEARKSINMALDDDSLEALRRGMALINEFSLGDEANARELKERLKTLEDEEAAQQVVRKKIRELVREPRTRVFYLKSAVQQLLSEAHMAGLNNSCEEVRAGLELLHWCTEHGKH